MLIVGEYIETKLFEPVPCGSPGLGDEIAEQALAMLMMGGSRAYERRQFR